MLPRHSDEMCYKPGLNIKERILGFIRLIFSDHTSRNLFLFLILNFSFAFVELFYGMWTNSLGLISDAFHMFFDCSALVTGLAASVVAKWRANERYTYGYVRAEIIGGFVNALLLVFIAFFIFSEAIERMAEPPEIKHDRLFVISVLGFIVNLVGIFAFNHGGHGHSHGGHGHSHGGVKVVLCVYSLSRWAFSIQGGSHGHSHGGEEKNHTSLVVNMDALTNNHGHSHDNHGHSHDEVEFEDPHQDLHSHSDAPNKIMQGVFLHILADTMGSVGVIISSLLIKYFDLMIADPICSVCIATLIVLSVLPLLSDSVGVLMMRTPKELEHKLPNCYQRVKQLEGVYSVQEPHFWTLCSEVFVGTVKLEVGPGSDARYIQEQAHNIFYQIGVRQLYIQIDNVSK